MIHIIGDSHVRTFEGAKGVECHWLSASTAFNFWKKHQYVLPILEAMKPEDEAWFCLGEIDCRIHIYDKSQRYGLPPYVILDNTAFSYMNYLSIFKKKYKIKVMTVPPAGPVLNVFEYEFYATQKERQQFSDYFNHIGLMVSKLGILDINSIPIVDVWYPGWYNLKEAYQDIWPIEHFQEDLCHIKNKVAIEFLRLWLEEHENR